MKIIDGLIQGSPEWLAFRKNKVMASMAPSIMGVGYDTPYSLWRQQLDLDPPKEINAAMKRGIELEPEALACVEKEIGCKFEKVVAVNDMYPWLGASFDGMSRDGAIIEIKTPYKAQSADEWWEKNEEVYYSQFQTQMVVANEYYCNVYVYMGNGIGKIFIVSRSDNYINKMIPKLKEFYDCMMNLMPPAMSEKDYIKKEGDEWNYWEDRYTKAKNCRLVYEEEEEACRQKLIEMAAGQNCKGNQVSITKVVSKGCVDYSKMVADLNLDPEPYRKSIRETWRINVGKTLD